MKLRKNGIKIEISFYFSVVLTLALLLDKSGISALSIISALLHETGHLLCLFFCSLKPKEISLGAFGMRIVRGNTGLSYKQELMVALSGPLVNLFLFAILLFFDEKFSAVNLALGIFNLLPIKPMDGYTALYFLLCNYFTDEKIKKITDIITKITLSFLFVAGVWVLLKSGYNCMLLIVCIYLMIVQKKT